MAWLLFVALLAVNPAASAQDEEASSGEAEVQPEEAERPPLTEIFEVRDDLQEFQLSVGALDTEAVIKALAERADDLPERLEELKQMAESGSFEGMTYEALIDLQTAVREGVDELERLFAELSDRSDRRDDQLDALAELRAQWQEVVQIAQEREAPPSVMEMVAATEPQLDALEDDLRADRDTALSVLIRMESFKQIAVRFQNEVRLRQKALEVEEQTASDAPIWDRRVWEQSFGGEERGGELGRYWRSLVVYLEEYGMRLLLMFAGAFAVVYWALRATGEKVAEHMKQDSVSLKAAAVFENRVSASILAALMVCYWLAPPGPAVFSHLLAALMPIPAAVLALTIFAGPIRVSVITLAVVLVLVQGQVLLETMPGMQQIVVALQALALIGAFLYDLVHDNWERAFPRVRPRRLRWLVRLSCLLFVVILVMALAGYIGFASTLRDVVFGGLGLGLVFVSASYVLTGLMLALLWMPPLRDIALVRQERWTIANNLRKGVRALAFIGWLVATLTISGFFGRILDAIGTVFATEWEIGAVTLNVSALIYGALIFITTLIISRFVRFLLETPVDSKYSFSVGAAFAISKLLRYAIIVIGFLFAIVVMGFDLTSVTVLAGALGVGLGFGLQSIFNNFFSGLILLVEQPIKINDVTKVGDLMGTVKKVGIRATQIETFDGAEVIVPNADLISKTVLNWTKSNRRRRVEIDVGVAYGTDPDEVIRILEAAAAEDENVGDDPASFAVFTGFGESSLNFRLYAWLADLSELPVKASRVRQSILAKLKEASITVPFPQRDVRVSLSSPGNVLPTPGANDAEPAPSD
jgi:potassium-dependent mechanosensitive channel